VLHLFPEQRLAIENVLNLVLELAKARPKLHLSREAESHGAPARCLVRLVFIETASIQILILDSLADKITQTPLDRWTHFMKTIRLL